MAGILHNYVHGALGKRQRRLLHLPYNFEKPAVSRFIMKAETAKLTIRLPKAHIEAAKEYARAHGITLTELVDRQLRSLDHGGGNISEALQEISGLLPKDLDARAAYDAYRAEKYRS